MRGASSPGAEICRLITDFERSKTPELAEKEGIFYTPYSLACSMAEACLTRILYGKDQAALLNIKLLDPSCGAGVFLAACLEILIAQLKRLKIDSKKNRRRLISFCLQGIDKDQAALETAARVFSEILEEEVSTEDCNLHKADFLFDVKAESGGFDLIIGNPPYGLSRGEKLTPDENRRLKKIFKDYRLGKVNKYMAFMAKGLELTRPGGYLSFVVPNSWLGIKSAATLRQTMIEGGTIEAVEHFKNTPFPRLEVETVVFRYRKSVISGSTALIEYNDCRSFELLKKDEARMARVARAPEFIIPLRWDNKREFLEGHLNESCIRIYQSRFNPMIALQAYASGKGVPPQTKETVKNHAFHSSQKLGEDYLPYLCGKDVSRYSINWSGQYLRYGCHLAEPQKLERFLAPRILLREILAPYPYKLIAAYCDRPFLYNKSVLHIIGDLPPAHFEALLGILNSKFAGYWIENFGRKAQRKMFPKLLNQDLRSFPLPKNFESSVACLAPLTASLKAGQNDADKIQQELDIAVLTAYQLSGIALP